MNNPLNSTDLSGYIRCYIEYPVLVNCDWFDHVGGSSGFLSIYDGYKSGGEGTYRLRGGIYYDWDGNEVSYDEVQNNYVLTNAAPIQSGYSVYYFREFGRNNIIISKGNPGLYEEKKGSGYLYHNPDAHYYTDPFVIDAIEGWVGESSQSTLENVNIGLNAAGTFALGGELFINANAGSNITYTTIRGVNAAVISAKVATAFKAAGTYTFYGSIAVDVVLSFAGAQSWGKTLVNTAVGGAAVAIGGVPGLVLGAGYVILDQTGMLGGSQGHYAKLHFSSNYLPGCNKGSKTHYFSINTLKIKNHV